MREKRHERDGKPLSFWQDCPTIIEDEEYFKSYLTRNEFNVLRKNGTEWPRSSTYDGFYPDHGYFACRACGLALYGARSKFNSGTGWPSFGSHIEGNVNTRLDYQMGKRVELRCARCSSHLGHVFAERNKNKFNPLKMHEERQCVNGICLMYMKSSLPVGSNPQASALVVLD